MAVAKGRDSNSQSGEFRRYVGLGYVNVLAVNPTKDEWQKITGSELKNEPEYTGVTQDNIKTAKVTLLCKVSPTKEADENCPIIPITFRFRKASVKGTKTGKYHIIDEYGRTAWATKEEIDGKKIPQYANGPASVTANYRLLVSGEEEFTNFLRTYLIIPNITFRDNSGQVITHANPAECEARLDHIMKIFDGDFKEIKSALSQQKNNQCKALFGVKSVDGKEYQDVFMPLFLSHRDNNHVKFANRLIEHLSISQTYANTYFGEKDAMGNLLIEPLHAYEVKPSTFTESSSEIPESPDFPSESVAEPENAGSDDLPF